MTARRLVASSRDGGGEPEAPGAVLPGASYDDDDGPGVIVLVALLGVLALAGWLGFAALASLGF